MIFSPLLGVLCGTLSLCAKLLSFPTLSSCDEMLPLHCPASERVPRRVGSQALRADGSPPPVVSTGLHRPPAGKVSCPHPHPRLGCRFGSGIYREAFGGPGLGRPAAHPGVS